MDESYTNNVLGIYLKLIKVEKIVLLLDQFGDQLVYENSNPCQLYDNVNIVSQYLKTFGSTLDKLYKDQLDRAFVQFRKYLLRTNSDEIIRLNLSELIELRANKWTLNDASNHYYKKKIQDLLEKTDGHIEPLDDYDELDLNDVMVSSGRFPKPSRIHNKNYYKDEVIIRNSDSGKVMGIKGKRIHMIEELSETTISFQRVNNNAKERLVQITGPHEYSVNFAKQLIEETIKRNMSPIRDIEENAMTDTLFKDNLSDSDNDNYNETQGDLTSFKYTLNFKENFVRITGNHLDLVNECMEVLDLHFAKKRTQINDSRQPKEFKEENESRLPNNNDVLDHHQVSAPDKTRFKYSADDLMAFRQLPECELRPKNCDHINSDLSILFKDLRKT